MIINMHRCAAKLSGGHLCRVSPPRWTDKAFAPLTASIEGLLLQDSRFPTRAPPVPRMPRIERCRRHAKGQHSMVCAREWHAGELVPTPAFATLSSNPLPRHHRCPECPVRNDPGGGPKGDWA